MSRTGRMVVIALLFAALVLVLLWFQGILFRGEHPTVAIEPTRLAAGARTARVERRSLARTETYPGFVEAVDPEAIAARVMAAVTRVAVREGDRVTAGQLLVELDDRDARARLAQAKAAQQAAEAGLEQATLGFERAQRLLQAEAMTAEQWEGARAARDAASAQATAAAERVAEAEAALSWYRIRSTAAGTVEDRHIDPGQLAVPGQPLLALYEPDRLRFAAAIPEERAAALSPGDELEIELGGERRRVALTAIVPAADRATGTVTVHAALAADDALFPGLLGRLLLGQGSRQALLVPAAALQRVGQIERVELVRDGEVSIATIKTGKRHDDMVEVLSGLDEGEEVVLP